MANLLSVRKFKVSTAVLVLSVSLLCPRLSTAKRPGGDNGGKPGNTKLSYAIMKLDDLHGAYEAGPADCVNDVNDSGNIVGTVKEVASGDYAAAFWRFDGTTSELTILDGAFANGINNHDEIVGADDAGTSMYWSSPTGQPVILPPLALGFPSSAQKINDDGVICGWAARPVYDNGGQFAGVTSVAVVWRVTWPGGNLNVVGPITLPTMDDRSLASALSETDAMGEMSVVGRFQSADYPNTAAVQNTAAVEWRLQTDSDGSVNVLGNPRLLQDGDAAALGTNDFRMSCGFADYGTGLTWLAGQPAALDSGGRAYARALDINNAGMVVGTGGPHSLDLDALVWANAAESPILLAQFLPKRNAPFAALWNALAVNDSGMIVGEGGDGLSTYGYIAIPTD